MSGAAATLDMEIRPYRDADEPRVLELLQASLGGGPVGERVPAFFRWKHLENPFGPSYLLLGEAEGRIVGLRAFMRWRFGATDGLVSAVRAVDTATHPDYQGRGVFSRLTRRSVDALGGEADLVFNTPNEKSLGGYLKMGWVVVGRVPVWVRVRRPLRFVSGLRALRAQSDRGGPRPPVAAATAAEALQDSRLAGLLRESAVAGDRYATPRDAGYLRWRYGLAPLLDYRAVAEERGGRLRGLAIFRVRPRGPLWEATVAEVLARPGDGAAVRGLLRRVAGAAPLDHVTCRLPSGPPAGSLGAGFVRAPGGMTLVVNPLRGGLNPDPRDPRSWALSLGDLEVF